MREIFAKALELTHQFPLCKGAFARTTIGNPIGAYCDNACALCTVGFIERACYELGVNNVHPALAQLSAVVDPMLRAESPGIDEFFVCAGTWNDNPIRTIDDVRAVFERLAA